MRRAEICALRGAVAAAIGALALAACVSTPSPPQQAGPRPVAGHAAVVSSPPVLRPEVVRPEPAPSPVPAGAPPAATPRVTLAVDLHGHGTYVLLDDRPDGVAPASAPEGLRVRALGGDDETQADRRARVYTETGFCDGVLGPDVELTQRDHDDDAVLHRALAAPLSGCAIHTAQLAVLDPPPAATQLVPLAADESQLGTAALDAARAAAARVAHVRASAHWATSVAWKSGDAIYAMVAGPACAADDETCGGDTAVAVTRARSGGAAEVVLARPAHFPWDEPVGARFDFVGVLDADGDGTVELEESAVSDSGDMLRLVRVGAQLPGDFVWRAQGDASAGTLGMASTPRALGAPVAN